MRTVYYACASNTTNTVSVRQGRTAIEQFLVEHQMSNNAGPDSSSTSFTGANNSASRRRSRGSRSEVGEQVASSSGEGKHVRFKQRSSGSIDALHSVRTKLSTGSLRIHIQYTLCVCVLCSQCVTVNSTHIQTCIQIHAKCAGSDYVNIIYVISICEVQNIS